MADRILKVSLVAKDDISPALKLVADSSKTASAALSEIGAKGGAGLDGFASKVTALKGELSTVGVSLAAIGAATTAAFGLSLKSSMGLESAMANVNSIARVSNGELGKLKTTVLDLSVQLGSSPTELAEGLYDITSSGFEAGDAIQILTKSAIAGRAGLTNTATAAKAVTAVLNAYGMSADQAGNVSDLLFKTVDSGVISFEELSGSLGRVLPLAASLKIPLQELTAAYADLTTKGVTGSEAETGIAALMTAALSPTTAMTAAVKEYGYASAEALIQAEGFAGYLQFLNQASGGNAAGMSELLGNVRATSAGLSLITDNASGYVAMLGEMNGAAQNGAYTQQVFATQTDTTAFALEKLRASLGAAKIAAGDAISPFVRFAAEGLTAAVNGFTALPGPVQTTIGMLGGLGGVVALAGGSFMLALPKIVEFRNAMTALGGIRGVISSLGAVMNPVALGLGALAVAGLFTWSMFKEGQAASKSLEDALISLGDVATNLRLGHRDNEAGFVDDFKRDVTEVRQSADDLSNSYDAMEAKAKEVAAQTGDRLSVAFLQVRDAYSLTNDEAKKFAEAQTAIGAAFADSRVDQEALNAALDAARAKYDDGTYTLDQYNEELQRIAASLSDYRAKADDAGSATEGLGKSSKQATESVSLLKEAMSDLMDIVTKAATADQSWGDRFLQSLGLDFAQTDKVTSIIDQIRTTWAEGMQPPDGADVTAQEWRDYINRATPGSAEYRKRSQEYKDFIADRKGDQDEDTASRKSFLEDQRAYNLAQAQADQERQDQQQDARDKEKQAFDERVEQRRQFAADWIATAHELMGTDDPLSQINLAGLGNQYSQLAGEIAKAGNAIDTVFRVVVGNTNAIKSQADSVHKWAEELINVRGELGRIDELMSADTTVNPYGEALLSQSQFDAAQNAYDSIAASTAKIAVNIDAIQAIQAPFIAGFLDQQSDLLENLRQQDEVQQRVTLGWMDQNTAMHANTIITQAAAAANGELGASGVRATEQMIAGAIAVNPFLEDMLTGIGLISVETDRLGNKTVTLNVEGAKDANNDIQQLTTSIKVLADLLDDGQINGSIDIAIANQDKLDQAKRDLDELDGKTATANVKVITEWPGGSESGLMIGGGDLSKWGPGMEGPTMTVPIKGEITTVSFPGNAAVGDGTGGAVPTVDMGAKVTTVDTSIIDTAGDKAPVDLKAKVSEVDTSTLTETDATIDVKAKISEVDTTALDAIKDTQITVKANVELNDPLGVLSHDYSPTAATATASRVLRVDVIANDPNNLLGGSTSPIDSLSASSKMVTVNLEDNASAGIAAINAAAIDDKTLNILGDGTIAFAAIDNVNGAAVDDKTLTIFGDATIALGAIDNVNSAQVFDKTMTINVVTAYSSTGTPPKASRHGGIPRYAHGGVITELAEAGTEMLHFATGGVMPVFDRGLYSVPPHTYVSPNNVSHQQAGMSAPTVHVHIHGNVFGIDDLETQIGAAIAREWAYAVDDRRRGAGL